MATSLDDLLNSGLGGIISSGGLPQEESMYQRQALSDREALSGRGLGISTVTRDALAKARVDSAMAAQSAQLAALGQAAGIVQGNANRSQQESQFSRNLKQQKDTANTQMLASGLGAGVGALGMLGGAAFGPEIRGGLRNAAGLGPRRESMLPPDQAPDRPGSAGGPGAVNTIPQFTDPGSGSGGAPSLSDFQMPTTSFGSGGFPATDFGDFGGLDLSALYDQSFNPYQDWNAY